MVILAKIVRNDNTYYYLKHGSDEKQLTKYLGKKIPDNLEELKNNLFLEFHRREWDPKIKSIKNNYQKQIKEIPDSIKLKNFESFGISFTHNTQKIEGSELSKTDTMDLLIFGVTPTKKSQIDTIETQKHYELFMKLISSKKLTTITKQTILDWHREIFNQTKIGEAGDIRRHRVGISGNAKVEFTLPANIPRELDEFIEWLNHSKHDRVVEFASNAHLKFVMIHPFADGNGRISRLIMNYILFLHDYPMFDIPSSHRRFYFKSLDQSNLKKSNQPFLKWFMKFYIKLNQHKFKS